MKLDVKKLFGGSNRLLWPITLIIATILGTINYIQGYFHFQQSNVEFPFFQMFLSSFLGFYLFLAFIPVIQWGRRHYDPFLKIKFLLWHIIIALIIATLHLVLVTFLNQVIIVYRPGAFYSSLIFTLKQKLILGLMAYSILLILDYFLEYRQRLIKQEEVIFYQRKQSSKILVKDKGKLIKLLTSEIIFCEAFDNYVKIHMPDQVHTIRKTLKQLLVELEHTGFVQIHRSFILNTRQVKTIKPLKSGDSEIELNDGRRLKMSRTYRKNMPALLASSG